MFPIRDTVPRHNPPIATWTLILVNALVFLLELSLPSDALARLFYLLGIVPARFSHPNWALWMGFPIDSYWPFLTSMFLHGGWLHIIANMWTGNPGEVGGVGWWAHVGGFASGILLHFAFVKNRQDYRRTQRDEYEIESAWLPANYWRSSR